MTVNIGTGNLLSPGAATTDLTIGGAGSLVITSAGQVGTVGVVSAPFLTSLANLQGTTTGLINIFDTDAAGLTVNGALSSGNGNISLTCAAGGTLQNTGTINAGSGVVVLAADNMALGATITGNGGIELSPNPFSNNRGIDLVDNSGGAGVLNLSLAEMQFLSSTGTVSLGIANTVGGVINIGNQGDVDLSAQGYSLELRGNSNVNFNFSAPHNLTIKNGGTLTVAIGAGQLLSPGDTSLDLAAVSGGSVNLKVTSASGIGSASAPLTTQLGSGAFSAPSTGGVGAVFLANTGDFLVNAPVFTSNGNYNVTTSGTFINTTAGTINAGSGTINITSGGLSIGGNMSAANVNLVPITAGLGIGLNDAAKAFNISATALQNLLVPSTGTVTLGSAAGTEQITIGTDGAIDLTGNSYNLTLQTLSGGAKFNNLLQLLSLIHI